MAFAVERDAAVDQCAVAGEGPLGPEPAGGRGERDDRLEDRSRRHAVLCRPRQIRMHRQVLGGRAGGRIERRRTRQDQQLAGPQVHHHRGPDEAGERLLGLPLRRPGERQVKVAPRLRAEEHVPRQAAGLRVHGGVDDPRHAAQLGVELLLGPGDADAVARTNVRIFRRFAARRRLRAPEISDDMSREFSLRVRPAPRRRDCDAGEPVCAGGRALGGLDGDAADQHVRERLLVKHAPAELRLVIAQHLPADPAHLVDDLADPRQDLVAVAAGRRGERIEPRLERVLGDRTAFLRLADALALLREHAVAAERAHPEQFIVLDGELQRGLVAGEGGSVAVEDRPARGGDFLERQRPPQHGIRVLGWSGRAPAVERASRRCRAAPRRRRNRAGRAAGQTWSTPRKIRFHHDGATSTTQRLLRQRLRLWTLCP